MANAKQIEKAAKDFTAAHNAYVNATIELDKLEKDMEKAGAVLKTGDVSKMAKAAIDLSKLSPRVGVTIKKVDKLRIEMEKASKEFQKVA